MKIDGGCHCGAVSYSAEIDPDAVVVCHCTDCQILSSTAFRTIVHVRSEDFRLLGGELKTYMKTAESGAKRAMLFCPNCGTQIYGTSDEDQPAMLSLRVGCVHQRAQLIPRRQIWCQSEQPWLGDLNQIPKTTRAPDDVAGR